ncbi:oligopeptide transport system ATP-binding protein [Breznakia sp. PF5-3]|uniref:ABC transporter ATP-binding protein n=1 Tax=unclassified Breznakia TaxID=2623764 RepID=UPI002406492E|nr:MULTISPECIES: ABC transporter ATP-binding protein [unclassified Breznakia]MDF9824592.1 oligopeptide transport system ATP-binding protein [Breznakia sp. PM6-1]MDF9835482.1 oligopeptide transport system ATP-binding protein [Breznakia sp. PF5-3]MDF9837892.1 oligopeptide transport system ATP-binding protein [Breznakia sp. PFB2-8]MDF9859815.1 oligopeptide transport system ATP-binding protein [Breznakia sp. PH5-24]
MSMLEIKNLSTEFSTENGTVQAVRDVSLHVEKGEVLGVVGESGSGKSQTMFSVMGLLAGNGKVVEGEIHIDGKDISPLSFKKAKEYDAVMSDIRGNDMAMIFQDPMTFLNPVLRIEKQLIEPILNHNDISKAEAKERAIELMRKVGIPSPEKRIRQYPFQFSGGMRQRIIIAIALACNPKVIIADEPTTALDVTIQAQVLDLIGNLKDELDSGIIMITHDLGVVASICDRIAIMYGGKIVEIGTADEIFYEPKHPYTKGLLDCISNPEDLDKKELRPIPGSPPDLLNIGKGCPFTDRCEKAMKICKLEMPDTKVFSDTHSCACWLTHPMAKKEGN